MKKISLIMLAILCLATVASAATITISTTITTTNGYNLGGNSYKCINMGDGSQTESQKPFTKGSGGTVNNGTLLAPGVDGCHLYNGQYVAITWQDVGEDASTKKGGTAGAGASGGWSAAADKVFQCNTGGGMTTGGSGSGFITYLRQNGGSSYACQLNAGGSASNGRRGCVSCAPSTTCSNYGGLNVSCCKCFKP